MKRNVKESACILTAVIPWSEKHCFRQVTRDQETQEKWNEMTET